MLHDKSLCLVKFEKQQIKEVRAGAKGGGAGRVWPGPPYQQAYSFEDSGFCA